MKRISPSVLTGLFSEGSKSLPILPPSGKRQAPLNMAFLGPVFAKGHVFEHDALHHLKTENLIANVQGQNAFERFFEYLSKDILRFYKQSYWLLASNTSLFFENLMEFLRQKLLSEDDKSMAREQQSPYLLKEQAVATNMLKSLRPPLMENQTLGPKGARSLWVFSEVTADKCSGAECLRLYVRKMAAAN